MILHPPPPPGDTNLYNYLDDREREEGGGAIREYPVRSSIYKNIVTNFVRWWWGGGGAKT